ncbi:MAG: hypothetical protein IT355_19420 [Gemmatimonadaceae bacterium]|nr:hypothetical protein [Gemmatimonadaceae bacterium]
MRADLCAILPLALLAACGRTMQPAAARPEPLPAGIAHAWITTPDRQHLLERQAGIPIARAGDAGGIPIDVDTAQQFQSMVGFGAALTDASAELLQQRLPSARRDSLLRALFGRDPGGAGFDMLRVTVGASDFSRTFFTYDDVPADTRDDAMAHFTIDSARASVLPLLRRAIAINPRLTLIAAPWSAPAWMKSSGSLVTGTLRDDARPAYATYLRRVVEAFAAEGAPIAYLTVQNEPHNEPKDYPGMRLDAAQRATFIGQHLGPLFARHGLRTRLLDWDHNWDEPGSPLQVLGDSAARRHLAGVAWHCYAGDVSAQSRVHDAHPDTEVFFTECAGGDWAPDFGDNLRWNVKTLIIGATRHWARGVTLWNLALDEQHGPHRGGCNDCRGVLTVDAQRGTVSANEEYYALAHASRFVRPGAVRIASPASAGDLSTVAFRNADDHSLVLIAVNDGTTARQARVRAAGQQFTVSIPAGAVATVVWR